MKEFTSLGALAIELAGREVFLVHEANEELDRVLAGLERTMRNEIGRRPAVGTWPPLDPETEAAKARMGYPADAPLLASGELQDSFNHETGMLEGVVGSTDQKMVYHEFGTQHVPPRPVVGPAAIKHEGRILKALGGAVVRGLVDGAAIHESLGYDKDLG